MRKLGFFIIFFMLLAQSTGAGIESFWRFDESSPNITDYSGNSNNLIFNSATTHFNKNNQFIEVPSSSSLNFTNNFTVTLWTKSPFFQEEFTWIGKKNYGGGGPWYFLTDTNSGENVKVDNANIEFRFNDLNDNIHIFSTSGLKLEAGKWNHIAFSKSSGRVRIYLNGELVKSWSSTHDVKKTGDPIVIGHEHGGFTNWFEGSMGEIRIYSSVLEQDEISSIYQGNSVVENPISWWTMEHNDRTFTDTASSNEGTFKSPSTKAVYGLSDFTHDQVTDISGNGNKGTFRGEKDGRFTGANDGQISGASRVPGIEGTALKFSGPDQVTISDNAALDFSSGGFTISTWFKTSNQSMDGSCCLSHNLIEKYGDGRGFMSGIAYSNTIYTSFYDGNGGYDARTTPTTDPANGNWHQLVGAHTDSKIKLYYDGNLIATHNAQNGSYANPSDLTIGSGFNGTIDNVKLFSDPLNNSQISELYNTKSASKAETRAEYRFESSSTGTTYDTGMISRGKKGKAIKFDGINDRISISESERVNTTLNSEEWTISFYFKPLENLDASNWGDYVQASTNNSGWFRIEQNGNSVDTITVYWSIDDGTSGGNPADYLCSFEGLSKERWYHLAVTLNSTQGGAECFVDGELTDSEPASSLADHESIKGSLALTSKPGKKWKADEFRIYSKALKPEKITNLKRLGRVEEELIGEWSFDHFTTERTGHDTFMIKSGISGKSLSFDGKNDDVNISTSTTYPQESMTVCSWIYPRSWSQRPAIFAHRSPILLDYQFGNAVLILDEERSSALSSSNLAKEKWWHVCGRYRESDNNASLIVNGKIVDSQIKDYNLTGAGSEVLIGHRDTGDGHQWFNGKIDEIKLKSESMRIESIKNLYRTQKAELVQPSYTQPLQNTADQQGILGTDSFNFDGIDDSAAIENFFYPHNGFTVSMWVKNNEKWGENSREIWNSGPGEVLIRGDSRNSWGKGSAIFHWNDGKDWYAIRTRNLSKNEWYHLVAVYNASSGEYRFYLNGEQQEKTPPDSPSISKSNRLEATTQKQVIGSHPSGSNNWKGKIDEVQFYSRPIGEKKIKELSLSR